MRESGEDDSSIAQLWEEVASLRSKVLDLEDAIRSRPGDGTDTGGGSAAQGAVARGRMPGTVQTVKEDSVILDVNPHQRVTQPTEDVSDNLEPGVQVAVTDSGGIAEVFDNSAVDASVRSMEVSDSPDVTYDDVGGLKDEIAVVEEVVQFPLTRPELFDEVGVDPPSGVLLKGPTGTGKTLLAKAVANHSDATFLRLSGSEVISKWVGESANRVRQLFELADERSPSVIFIDEIDALAGERRSTESSGESEVQRATNQLLAEMDGFTERRDVQVMAATNRPEVIDPAVTRPGRFDRTVEVGVPDRDARLDIFGIQTRSMAVTDDVSYAELAATTVGATGAEIEGVCTQAGINAIRDGRTTARHADFEAAIEELGL
jgi:proteasome regulatory subunit